MMKRACQDQFVFGDFILVPAERQLLKCGTSLYLAPKTFDILNLLVKQAGSLVTKDQIFENVWPGVSVEESNITNRISTIRKVLGDDANNPTFIEKIPTQGYRFFHPVKPLFIFETGDGPEIHKSLPPHSESAKPESANEEKIDDINKDYDNPRRIEPTIPLPTHPSHFKLIATFVILLLLALILLAAFISYKWGAAETRALVAEKELQTRPRRDDSQQPSSEKKQEPASNMVPVNCPGDAPDYPVFNIDPLTFRDKGTQICSDFPLIDIALDQPNPTFSQSMTELNSVRSFKIGDQLAVMLYIHNGAANNLPPSQTTAKNVKIKTSLERTGNVYTITGLYSADNAYPRSESIKIAVKDDEVLALIKNSGFVYTFEGKVILDMQNLDLGNSTFTLGDLDSGWEYSLFLTYKLLVMKK